MKRVILSLLLTVVLLLCMVSSSPPKVYTFKFTDTQVGELWNVVNMSNAPHLQVEEVKALIQNQLKDTVQNPIK